MKRTAEGDPADPWHPAVAFYREVLTVKEWAALRADFLAALQARGAGVRWAEPAKLWRHSQEALGKWLLSQIARAPTAEDAAGVFFFPTTEFVARCCSCGGGGGAPHTFDEQLVRDLSLKSDGAADPAVVARLQTLVRDFDLGARCQAAHERVRTALRQCADPLAAARPVLRRLEESDPRRPYQQRMRGPIAEFSVASRSPRRAAGGSASSPPPQVSIPWPAYEKLRACYAAVSEAAEAAAYPALAAEERALLRAATVALRYEGGLATGSLQLCADTTLKQHLHACGFRVVDLCASPINAYMGLPRRSAFGRDNHDGHAAAAAEAGAEAEREELAPNAFCSAFYDTDRYFGSLGSALNVDVASLPDRLGVGPAAAGADPVKGRRLLLTLDVPYDEDLCELMFSKLASDMAGVGGGGGAPGIDYLLVLPLWWDVPMRIRKQIFTDDDNDSTGREETEEARRRKQEMLAAMLKERTAQLTQGHVVPRAWPETLAAAAGDALGGASSRDKDKAWVVFDGVFVGGGYAYFCTATNRWLRGVTTTEVIALRQPHAAEGAPDLTEALRSFYGRV